MAVVGKLFKPQDKAIIFVNDISELIFDVCLLLEAWHYFNRNECPPFGCCWPSLPTTYEN